MCFHDMYGLHSLVLVDVEVCFRLGLSGACFSNRSYLLKRKSRLEPATTAEFFLNRLSPCCINPLNGVRVCGVEQPV
jgi:hypothetical protein